MAAVMLQCEQLHHDATQVGNSVKEKLVLYNFTALRCDCHCCKTQILSESPKLPPVAFQWIPHLHNIFCYASCVVVRLLLCAQRGSVEIKL